MWVLTCLVRSCRGCFIDETLSDLYSDYTLCVICASTLGCIAYIPNAYVIIRQCYLSLCRESRYKVRHLLRHLPASINRSITVLNLCGIDKRLLTATNNRFCHIQPQRTAGNRKYSAKTKKEPYLPQSERKPSARQPLTLAAGAITYPVQVVCAGVRLPERNSTGILVRPDSVCRQYRTSPATISVDLKSGGIPQTRRALETVRLPLQVHERGTDYRQPSDQPPNRSLPSKKNFNRLFLYSHFGCDEY